LCPRPRGSTPIAWCCSAKAGSTRPKDKFDGEHPACNRDQWGAAGRSDRVGSVIPARQWEFGVGASRAAALGRPSVTFSLGVLENSCGEFRNSIDAGTSRVVITNRRLLQLPISCHPRVTCSGDTRMPLQKGRGRPRKLPSTVVGSTSDGSGGIRQSKLCCLMTPPMEATRGKYVAILPRGSCRPQTASAPVTGAPTLSGR